VRINSLNVSNPKVLQHDGGLVGDNELVGTPPTSLNIYTELKNNGIGTKKVLDEILRALVQDRPTYLDINLRDSYVGIDSYNRNTGADYASPIPSMEFDIARIALGTKVINTYKEPQRVVSATVGKFRIPLDNTSWLLYDKIMLDVSQFSHTAFMGKSFPHQFEFDIATSPDGRHIILTPIPGFNRVTFFSPLPIVDKMTLTFYDSFNKMVFNPDRGIYSASNTNPAMFTGPTNTLQTGDVVVITNFKSTSQPLNQSINEGYFPVTVVSSTQFTIPVDFSGLTSSVNNIHVYYQTERIVAPFTFQCME
jgi:hypothetical protein